VTTANTTASADLLDTILAATRRIVEVREARESVADLARQAGKRPPRPGVFREAVARRDRFNVIAECKRRSPSRGVLRAEYDAAAIAGGYAAAGAAAISVLTEPTFFDGSLTDLEQVRKAVEVPVLRKDFIVSQYQLLEARAAGADAVLLIVAALSTGELRTLTTRAASLGLETLVEVHSAEELTRAIDAGAEIIGVNNRNLRTLMVDLRVSDEVMARVPDDIIAVSESGLKTSADLVRLRKLGYRAFLIGERFMTDPDPAAGLRTLLQGAQEERQ
jgi:indole-3-glycerol phosphate synthase